jgi:pyruvate dehydrogenase E1 component alpha subunit/2-oxoisovalerate dehydrogenase E1 component alpha subunit
MLQTVTDATPAGETLITRDTTLAAYQFMLRARLLDDKFAALYRAGKIHGGVFLGRGQEALSASVGVSLKKTDIFAPLIRDAAGRLAFGETILDALRNYLGSSLGPMRARDGNVHRGKPLEGYFPMISHLGAMISVVNGALFARRMKGISGTVGATCLGDGATSTGAFHEALNQAAVEKLPLVLVLADNQYAYSTPTSRQFICDDLADKAIGYGVAAHSVDGTDLAACLKTVGEAVARARVEEGPQLVVAKLLRLCGHGEHDDSHYVDPKLKNSPLGRDCLKVAEELLLRQKWADTATLAIWRGEITAQIDEAVARVRREPAPDPYDEKWLAISSTHLTDVHDEDSGS